MNSTATAAELARTVPIGESEAGATVVALVLLTSIAMFVRNLVILAIFAPAAVSIASWPLLAMTGGAVIFAWKERERGTEPVRSRHLDSPVSLRQVLN